MSFLNIIVILIFVSVAFSDEQTHRVVVHQPYQHQQVLADAFLGLEYGISKSNEDQTPSDNVQVKLEWSKRGNTSTTGPLQLNVHHGYSSRIMGTHQDYYNYRWKTPACPFFIRYQPQQYQFSLLFVVNSDASSPSSSASTIRIPLDFTVVNVTGLHCDNKIINPPRTPQSKNSTSKLPSNHQ